MASTPVKRKRNTFAADPQRGSSNKKQRHHQLEPRPRRSLSLDSLDSDGNVPSPSETRSSDADESIAGERTSVSPFSWTSKSRQRSLSVDSLLWSPTTKLGQTMEGVVISGACIPSTPIYRNFSTEVTETKHLDVPGENKSHGRGLPVRNLNDFTFYDANGAYVPFAMVPLSMLSRAHKRIHASGIVSRCLEDSDDSDSDIAEPNAELLASLKHLVDYWVDYNIDQVETIWVKTTHAWYILGEPAPLYAMFYQPFWTAHHMTWLVAKAARKGLGAHVTFENFCRDLTYVKDNESRLIMGRDLEEKDLDGDYVVPYIIDQLSSVDDSEEIFFTPLCKHLADCAAASNNVLDVYLDFEVPKHGQASKRPTRRAIKDPKTVTMPLVHELATAVFLKTLLKVGKSLDRQDSQHKLLQAPATPTIMHPDQPTNVEWDNAIKGAPGYYGTIWLDGESYRTGDNIMVSPGEDDLAHRAKSALEACSQSQNELVNEVWFCRIMYMFDKPVSSRSLETERIAHVRWYEHGSRTILQETAHPYALFALAECTDVPVGAILGQLSLQLPQPGAEEPYDYHCSFLWEPDEARFLDKSILDRQTDTRDCFPYCPCCALNEEREREAAQETLIHSHKHATVRGVQYHRNDFVYIAAEPNHPYLIGQIRRFVIDKNLTLENTQVELTRVGRFDDVARKILGTNVKKDERRLFLTKQTDSFALPLLEGKCFVLEKDQLRALDDLADSFYIDRWCEKVQVKRLEELLPFSAESLSICNTCVHAAEREREQTERYRASNIPLKTMELFAGAGGLSTGLEQSGFVNTRWAIELSSGAAATFQANHPDAIVYNQDTNLCLQNAINVKEDKSSPPLYSLGDGKKLPPMPQKGDVDLITGGFPCQSFSGLNHHKRLDDMRTTLVANMLSYVEFYEPQFVLMENVRGLLQHHKQEEAGPDTDEEGGKIMRGAIVKFILRALTCLGYQTQIRVLQAADYGSPQRRQRVIFMAARRSQALPSYPIPTHVAPRYGNQINKLPTHDQLSPVMRSERGCAPLRALVVADAISDLPGFDWRHPNHLCKEDEEETGEGRQRKAFPKRSAVSTATRKLTGFLGPANYMSSPRTRYQQTMRGDKTQVTLQCSRAYTSPVVERVWHVCSDNVMGPYDLPRALWTPIMVEMARKKNHAKLNKVWQQQFIRLGWDDEPFNTALTACRPFSKGSKVLHPTQKRILTARECARSQGFPDSYEFAQPDEDAGPAAWGGLLDDIHKQIGNAVPVPLAQALGRSLGKSLVAKWLETNHDLDLKLIEQD